MEPYWKLKPYIEQYIIIQIKLCDFDVFWYCLCIGVFGDDLVLTSPRLLSEAWEFMHVMIWWFGLDLLKPTMVMWFCIWWDVFTICYCFPVFLCEAEVYVHEIPDLTILGHRSVIFDCFQSLWEDWDVLSDLFLMMSCGDMFDLTILGLD